MAASFCALLGSEGFATSGSRWDLSRSLAAFADISDEVEDVCFPERVFGGCKYGAEWAMFSSGLVDSSVVVVVVVMVVVVVVGCTGVSLVARFSGFVLVLGALRVTLVLI